MAVRFSPRQAEIVGLIASGYSDKQIAVALRVSKRTVRTQLERLYAANGLHSRAQAVHVWAVSAPPAAPPPPPHKWGGPT